LVLFSEVKVMNNNLVAKHVLLGLTAMSLTMSSAAFSQTVTTKSVTTTTTSTVAGGDCASVLSACGRLFDVDANAAGMTAQERAALIERNLDYALIHAHVRTPNAVAVVISNNNPVVILDGMQIATADGNSAARHGVSQMELAEQWADRIRQCLADAAGVDRYLAMLTGQFAQQVTFPREERVAYARAGLYMPVRLLTPMSSERSILGQTVTAQLTTDIPLPTSFCATQFEAYLPAGTLAIGQLVDASNSFTRNCALGIRFDHFQMPDGEIIPINGHIMGGIGSWVYFNTHPAVTEFGALTGTKVTACNGMVAAKGSVCGGWVGYPIGAGIDIPFQKMVLKRGTGVAVGAGTNMFLQLAAPTAIAICTNCSGPNALATVSPTPLAIGGGGHF
jgi:hypothetical protein